jgi:hypothetical protein
MSNIIKKSTIEKEARNIVEINKSDDKTIALAAWLCLYHPHFVLFKSKKCLKCRNRHPGQDKTRERRNPLALIASCNITYINT